MEDSTDFRVRFSVSKQSVFACSVVVSRRKIARRHDCSGIAEATVFEVLPRITGNEVDVRIDSIDLLLIVQVELKKSVLLHLPSVSSNRSTVAVVVLPSEGRVLGDCVVFLSARPVVTEVQVSVEVGEEVESIVELQVAVRTEDVGIVVAFIHKCNGVLCSVDVESSTVTPYEVTVVELTASARLSRHRIVVISFLSRVESDSSAYDTTTVNEVVVEVVTFSVQLYAQVTVEEFRSQVDTCSQAVHARTVNDTVVLSVVNAYTIRKDAGSTTNAEVVVVRNGSAEHVVLPVVVVTPFAVEISVVVRVALCSGVANRAESQSSVVTCAPIVSDNFSKFGSSEHVNSLSCFVDIHVSREVNLRLTGFTFLCCDDDDTVRCTRTVDSGCRSILEDGHRFYVVGAYHSQRVRHTLH